MNEIFSNQSNYAKIVGKNFGYYANKWSVLLEKYCDDQIEKLEKYSVKHISFNLFALIFGPLWFLYRKMYFISCILILNATINPLFALLLQLILFPIYANKLYFLHVSQKIKKLNKQYQNPDQFQNHLLNVGGISKKSVVFGIVLIALLGFTNANYNQTIGGLATNNKADYISKDMKQSILVIQITDNQTVYTVEQFVAILAGSEGSIEWKRDKNDYYIYIKHKYRTDHLKFTYNPNTNYILHVETVVNNQKCDSSWRCLL